MTTSTLTISHDAADGTVCLGTARGDGSAPILKSAGFRWSGRAGFWYISGSRDRQPQQWRIDQAAAGLRALGLDVTVDVDATARPIAEVEADRADGLAAAADRAESRSTAAYEASRRIADMIPMGQPILVGHHSEGRHRRDLDRMGRSMDRSCAESRDATELARRAAASTSNEARRLTLPVTLRRIDRLEVELRDIDRKLVPREPSAWDAEHPAEIAAWRTRITARRAELVDEVSYWRAHAAGLTDAGAKQWGPDDFQKGDRVNGDGTVVRVNAKTLTVAWDVWAAVNVARAGEKTKPLTHPLRYDEVRSRQAAP